MVTRPVITSMAKAIRLNWRRVVAGIWGWRHWQSATMSMGVSSESESCSRGGRQLYDSSTMEALSSSPTLAKVLIDTTILVDMVNQRLGDAERFRNEILAYVQR